MDATYLLQIPQCPWKLSFFLLSLTQKKNTYSDGFSSKSGSHGNSSSGGNQSYSSYQNGSEVPDLQSAEFKKDKEDFFGRVQADEVKK